MLSGCHATKGRWADGAGDIGDGCRVVKDFPSQKGMRGANSTGIL